MDVPNMGRSTHRARGGKGHVRPTQLKRDDDIMGTNDSSIVSKRSVTKLYFPNEPDFYEPFVQKYARRNPLINRGYWLRMHAIEQVVRVFLDENSEKQNIIVNLGCGYDPLPFQFWHRYALKCDRSTFVDVDYPQLMEKKRDRMLSSALLRDELLKTNLRSSAAPIHLRSDRYMALGCDLKDLETLERILRTEFDLASTSILFVAEVSITYMPVLDSNALIKWATRFDDAAFCLLEQYLPQGPDHPFAHTMLKHFNKLQTPIYAVKDYPSLDLQQLRFTNAGWASIDIGRNLWDLWLDDTFTPPTLRRSLDTVEPFDEWEEFALFAGHYFLIVASNRERKDTRESKDPRERKDLRSPPSNCGSDAKTNSIVMRSATLIPGVTPRRFGAALTLPGGTVAVHGGQGVQRRLESIDVLSRSTEEIDIQPPVPLSRICHTITAINGSEALLVGGRKSPSYALSESWLLKDKIWRQVGDLRPERFRHSSTRVKVPLSSNAEVEGVLVVGGKTGDGIVLDECCIWLPNQGWQILPVTGTQPCARFGAAISSMSEGNGGLLLGGMTSDGTVLDDLWEYNISAAPHLQLHFKDRTNDIRCKHDPKLHARFGASLVPFGKSLLLMGGIPVNDILSLADEFLLISVGGEVTIERPTITVPKNTWPLLVGCNTASVSEDEVLVLGGGAVCFSMGSFWNQGCFSITKHGIPDRLPWNVSTCEPKLEDAGQGTGPRVAPLSKTKGKDKSKGKGKGGGKGGGKGIGKAAREMNANRTSKPKAPTTEPRVSNVPRVQLQSVEKFAQLVTDSKPVIIEGLDLGTCTTLWTLDYFKDKLGSEREIVIHDCTSDRMTFKDKNFTYTKTTLSAFIDGISSGAKSYLRAVSASQPNKLPTKLEDDFPELAGDFRLPPEILVEVQKGYHSSPLRISGPVSLWLHYDVLANVLCQIQGSKTMRLYPPSDVRFLEYPPGGSSSNLDTSDCQDPRLHPHIASLRPGDVLFIPPMWSHAATPEEGHSIAVNVFWRNLEKGYAAGKDVYGNRDLQAYETGRRDVEKILKAFRGLPTDLSGFYIDRLASELQERAN